MAEKSSHKIQNNMCRKLIQIGFAVEREEHVQNGKISACIKSAGKIADNCQKTRIG